MTITPLETFTGANAAVWDLPAASASTARTPHPLGPHLLTPTNEHASSLPDRECLGCQRVLKGEDFYAYCTPSCRTADRYAADEFETEVAA